MNPPFRTVVEDAQITSAFGSNRVGTNRRPTICASEFQYVIAFDQYIEDLRGDVVTGPVSQGHLDKLRGFPSQDIFL